MSKSTNTLYLIKKLTNHTFYYTKPHH